MNLRKGFGRIYTLFSGLVLLAICIVAVQDMPNMDSMDRIYAEAIGSSIYRKSISPSAIDAECDQWRSAVPAVGDFCKGREAELRRLPEKRIKHFIERFMALAGTAAVLYAIRRAARWIGDGFADRR